MKHERNEVRKDDEAQFLAIRPEGPAKPKNGIISNRPAPCTNLKTVSVVTAVG